MIYGILFLALLSLVAFHLGILLQTRKYVHAEASVTEHPARQKVEVHHMTGTTVGLLVGGLFVGITLVWLLTQHTENAFFVLATCVNFGVGVVLVYELYQVRYGATPDGVYLLFVLLRGLAMGSLWHINQGWLVYNFIAVCAAAVIMNFFTFTHARYLFMLLGRVVIYDIWGVFGTGIITDVATAGPQRTSEADFWLPAGMLLVVPRDLFNLFTPVTENIVGILGTGDVFFSGLVVLFATHFRLHWWVIVGYILGLIASTYALIVLQTGMPAMIFLAPATLLSLLAGSLLTKRPLTW